MKNINQYNYFRLLIFACFIGLFSGSIIILIKKLFHPTAGQLDPFWGGAINAGIIIFSLIFLNKIGKDKFLLKRKNKNL
ncbi:MAG: hypothetical protein KAS51_02615 [Candidatus Omnitrophica bacterium]|nr:hypothetical protein [Candidatus Omnitrophota bacterium]